MDNINQKTHSTLNISSDVLLTIAQNVISQIDGVQKLANLPVKYSLLATKTSIRPIKFTQIDDRAIVDIGVVLKFNYRIKDVCEKIQKAVKDEIQDMSSIAISKVNIYVASAS